MGDAVSQRRWYRFTPARWLLGLVVLDGFLLAADAMDWFPTGWPVLIALAAVAATLLALFGWFAAALAFRRRFQFGLRWLLALVLAVAIPCSWLSWEMKKARKQQDAADEIARYGGSVNYDYETFAPPNRPEPRGPAWLRKQLGDSFFNPPREAQLGGQVQMPWLQGLWQLKYLVLSGDVRDDGLRHVEALTRLELLWLFNLKITDAGLKHLEGLNRLQSLTFDGTPINDAGLRRLERLSRLTQLRIIGDDSRLTDLGLQHLRGLKQLQELSLYCDVDEVTDAGLKHLEGLTQLELVCLGPTRATDAGLRHLGGLTRLGTLSLHGWTKITDAGLEHLAGLRRLKALDVTGTRVTEQGVQRLRAALPDCDIFRGDSSIAPAAAPAHHGPAGRTAAPPAK